MNQYRHLQGVVNAIMKLNKHYLALFSFLAVKDSDIWEKSPSPVQSLRIKKAVLWMHANNHLYSNFFYQYETLMQSLRSALSTPTFWRTEAYRSKSFWKRRLLPWLSPWMQNTLMIFLG